MQEDDPYHCFILEGMRAFSVLQRLMVLSWAYYPSFTKFQCLSTAQSKMWTGKHQGWGFNSLVQEVFLDRCDVVMNWKNSVLDLIGDFTSALRKTWILSKNYGKSDNNLELNDNEEFILIRNYIGTSTASDDSLGLHLIEDYS